MIKVSKITIEEFRGIRSLNIDFNKKNFAICGRNGTGKSGIVDAIEFGLTGNISRLSGEGMGAISLKDHAPHVDSRNNPEKSSITLKLDILDGNKTVTIKRSVKTPNSPIITPNSEEVLDVLNKVSTHPEFTLSRRELIKYVISAPGDRAKEVQALLRLEKVEIMRGLFLKISNSSKKDLLALKNEKETAKALLMRALEISELTNIKLLEAINKKRSILGLPNVTTLSKTTSLKDGLASSGSNPKNHIPQIQALADIEAADQLFNKYLGTENAKLQEKLSKELKTISNDPAIVQGVTREQFLKTALDMIDKEVCPLCDTPWDLEKLRDLIQSKLHTFDQVFKQRTQIEKSLDPLAKLYNDLKVSLNPIVGYGNTLKINTHPITELEKILSDKNFDIKNFTPLDKTINAIKPDSDSLTSAKEIIKEIKEAISKMPDTAAQDSARDFLTICQDRLENYREVSLRHKQAEDKANLADKLSSVYAKVSTEVLNDIYKEVEKDFIDFYRFINNEDENDFSAELTPSIGKLSFDVDFYGRGFFPPGAYHSEGHQDGMGLCLYLALMKHLLGGSFTFAVLDDVLMSVDSGHRREVCKLLKEKFSETQFVVTTHDEVWLKHMKTVGLLDSSSSIYFKNWNVDSGPSEWNDRDVWAEIDTEIKQNNIREAAGLLRHYLEYISSEICHQLRAKVEYHGDGQFDLGDLLPSATSRFSKLLSEGESVTKKWKNDEETTRINDLKENFKKASISSQVEQWQTNSAIHYNEWANLEAKDFAPVAKAFKELIKYFFCPDCNSVLYVIPKRGPKENLRCSCGKVSFNLKEKG